jgi:chromosome segregation ATPase
MARELVTRQLLARELALNAATRPLNIGVAVVVAVAAFALNALWLLPAALLVYIAMGLSTFFDAAETDRISRRVYERARGTEATPELDGVRLAPSIAERLDAARAAEGRIREAVETAPLKTYDVAGEVDGLMAGVSKLARRAQEIHTYLALQDEEGLRLRLQKLRATSTGDRAVDAANAEVATALEEQLAAIAQLKQHLSRLEAQMDHAAVSLEAIHGHIVRLNAADETAAEADVAGRLRSLRREVNVAADAMRDTHEELTNGRD